MTRIINYHSFFYFITDIFSFFFCGHAEILKYTHNFFFYHLRILHDQRLYNDHDVISYLPHTVVTTAEPTTSPTSPTSPPLPDDVPNFAVKQIMNYSEFTRKLDLLEFRFRTYCVQLIRIVPSSKNF